MGKVAIIDYGAGNTQSVIFTLNRLGIDPVLSAEAEVLKSAERVIFPGVGHAGQAMRTLKDKGLDKLIVDLKQPVLGVCIGMQLMCNRSEEANTDALGIFDVDVLQFKGDFKVPHMGWNNLEFQPHPLFTGIENNDHGYYVHSYYAPVIPDTIATTTYAFPFSAALQRDNFYGCQFHPEKSGPTGQKIIENFLNLPL